MLMRDEHCVHSAVSFTELGQEVVTVRRSGTCLTFRHSVACMKQNIKLDLHHEQRMATGGLSPTTKALSPQLPRGDGPKAGTSRVNEAARAKQTP